MAATQSTPDRSEVFVTEEERTARTPTGVPRTRWSRTRGGAGLLILSLSTIGWTVVLSAPPARADCSILDPICVVEEATEPVTDVVEPVLEDVIEEVVEPTIEVVVEVVDEVIEGAGDPITPVAPAPPIEGPMATVEAPGLGTQPSDTPATPATPPDPAGPIGPMEPGSGPDVDGGSTIVNGVVVVSEDPSSALPSARTPSMGAIAPNVTFAVGRLSDRLAGTLFTTGTAAIAFPLLLALVVASFLLVQGRVDRRDPRFVLAPVRPGVLRFD